MLTIPQVKEILKNPIQDKSNIAKAIKHEDRVRLHSETLLSENGASSALGDLLDKVKKLLPDDKFQSFKVLLRFPLPTVDLTDKIYSALQKVFDGRNPVFNYEFISEDAAADWEDYRTKTLKHIDFWKNEGFERMKTAINSVMIVDLDVEQTSERPNPYMYFLNLSKVIDFDFVKNDNKKFDWIIFRNDKNQIAVFCDTYYRVFETKSGSGNDIVDVPLIEVEHDLQYCPARFFWSSCVSISDKITKKSPLSNYLMKLDKLFFDYVSTEHLELYGKYPIVSVFSSDCDFEDSNTGHYCDGGHLRTRDGSYLYKEGRLASCQKCKNKRLDGAGTVIEIDPPSVQNDNLDLRNPVQITEAPVKSLEYNNDRLQDLKNEIYNGVTGFQSAVINNQAINEKQVIAMFERLESALQDPQENIEQAIKWTDETICLLRYGSDFVSASISLGTEHYLLTPAQIMTLYEEAKKTSMSVYALDFLENQYFETEFRNNPSRILRHKIISQIDSFRHLSNQEINDLQAKGGISIEDYIVKMNLSSLISTFERENISITEFGENVAFDTKINQIKLALKSYAIAMMPLGSKQGMTTKEQLELYGIGVRSGAITPQLIDEETFRQKLQIEELSSEGLQAWKDDKGIRRPVTLKSQAQLQADLNQQ